MNTNDVDDYEYYYSEEDLPKLVKPIVIPTESSTINTDSMEQASVPNESNADEKLQNSVNITNNVTDQSVTSTHKQTPLINSDDDYEYYYDDEDKDNSIVRDSNVNSRTQNHVYGTGTSAASFGSSDMHANEQGTLPQHSLAVSESEDLFSTSDVDDAIDEVHFQEEASYYYDTEEGESGEGSGSIVMNNSVSVTNQNCSTVIPSTIGGSIESELSDEYYIDGFGEKVPFRSNRNADVLLPSVEDFSTSQYDYQHSPMLHQHQMTSNSEHTSHPSGNPTHTPFFHNLDDLKEPSSSVSPATSRPSSADGAHRKKPTVVTGRPIMTGPRMTSSTFPVDNISSALSAAAVAYSRGLPQSKDNNIDNSTSKEDDNLSPKRNDGEEFTFDGQNDDTDVINTTEQVHHSPNRIQNTFVLDDLKGGTVGSYCRVGVRSLVDMGIDNLLLHQGPTNGIVCCVLTRINTGKKSLWPEWTLKLELTKNEREKAPFELRDILIHARTRKKTRRKTVIFYAGGNTKDRDPASYLGKMVLADKSSTRFILYSGEVKQTKRKWHSEGVETMTEMIGNHQIQPRELLSVAYPPVRISFNLPCVIFAALPKPLAVGTYTSVRPSSFGESLLSKASLRITERTFLQKETNIRVHEELERAMKRGKLMNQEEAEQIVEREDLTKDPTYKENVKKMMKHIAKSYDKFEGANYQAAAEKLESMNERRDSTSDQADDMIVGMRAKKRRSIARSNVISAEEAQKRRIDRLMHPSRPSDHVDNAMVLTTVEPVHDPELGHRLEFYGRVSERSAKNFQLRSESHPSELMMLFGRRGQNEFSLDFRSPLSALQAMAIAISAFLANIK